MGNFSFLFLLIIGLLFVSAKILMPIMNFTSHITCKAVNENAKSDQVEAFDEEVKDNQRSVMSEEFVLAQTRKIIFVQVSSNIRLNNISKLPTSYPNILKQPPKKV